jgi:hypothetical protein
MRRALWICLLSAPLWVTTARGDWGGGHFCPPMECDWGINFRFNVHVLDWSHNSLLSPWYLYFPGDPRCQAPAGYPNWPGPMALTPPPGTLPPPVPDRKGPADPGRLPAPNGPALPPQASFYRPAPVSGVSQVGYIQAAPGYWFSR